MERPLTVGQLAHATGVSVRGGRLDFGASPGDYEQLAETLKGLHVVGFAMLMLRHLTPLIL